MSGALAFQSLFYWIINSIFDKRGGLITHMDCFNPYSTGLSILSNITIYKDADNKMFQSLFYWIINSIVEDDDDIEEEVEGFNPYSTGLSILSTIIIKS